eukprot:TRINITY_DN8833_c0_g1_i1.p1 TRINITY_DN8833_c0_g1~~TRINITY_DN8833_c0_g1_i1.p1  ORF type:complete len:324 (-),score=71.56 TRINITY_DN8833_c0_g1_i1:1220-2191(-)
MTASGLVEHKRTIRESFPKTSSELMAVVSAVRERWQLQEVHHCMLQIFPRVRLPEELREDHGLVARAITKLESDRNFPVSYRRFSLHWTSKFVLELINDIVRDRSSGVLSNACVALVQAAGGTYASAFDQVYQTLALSRLQDGGVFAVHRPNSAEEFMQLGQLSVAYVATLADVASQAAVNTLVIPLVSNVGEVNAVIIDHKCRPILIQVTSGASHTIAVSGLETLQPFFPAEDVVPFLFVAPPSVAALFQLQLFDAQQTATQAQQDLVKFVRQWIVSVPYAPAAAALQPPVAKMSLDELFVGQQDSFGFVDHKEEQAKKRKR